MNFGINDFVSQNYFQFKLLLTITFIMLRNSHFGLKFPKLTLAQVIGFFWKLMNSFLSENCSEIPPIFFVNAQISPKQLGFVTSDLACAECNPEEGMHFLSRLKKFHFAIAN